MNETEREDWLRRRAEDTAKHMPGWVVLLPNADRVETRIVRTVDDAFIALYLGDDERFEIAAGWPKYSDGTRYHPDRHLKITVSSKKTPEAMAGDIERRLLSGYLPAYAKALSEVKGREAEQAAAQKCAEHLGSIVGATVHENGRGGFGLYETMPECITKVNVRTGLRVSMELADLDEITAARILTLLQKREEALDEDERKQRVSATPQQGREEEH